MIKLGDLRGQDVKNLVENFAKVTGSDARLHSLVDTTIFLFEESSVGVLALIILTSISSPFLYSYRSDTIIVL